LCDFVYSNASTADNHFDGDVLEAVMIVFAPDSDSNEFVSALEDFVHGSTIEILACCPWTIITKKDAIIHAGENASEEGVSG
jgi:hypothetical protein